MKSFKIIFGINLVWLVLTLVLYTTFYYGLMAQFVLGIFQVLSSLLLLFYWKHIWERDKRLVYYYWLMVIGYFAILGVLALFNALDDSYSLVGLILIPMGISLYFAYILFRFLRIIKRTSQS